MCCGEKLSYPQDAIEIVVCLVWEKYFPWNSSLCTFYWIHTSDERSTTSQRDSPLWAGRSDTKPKWHDTGVCCRCCGESESSEVDTCLSVFPSPRPLHSQIKFKEALKKLWMPEKDPSRTSFEESLHSSQKQESEIKKPRKNGIRDQKISTIFMAIFYCVIAKIVSNFHSSCVRGGMLRLMSHTNPLSSRKLNLILG